MILKVMEGEGARMVPRFHICIDGVSVILKHQIR